MDRVEAPVVVERPSNTELAELPVLNSPDL
jgi:hypothetical protein